MYAVDAVTLHIGSRLAAARQLRGFSQDSLAAQLGISREEFEEYERGAAQLSADQLYEIARALQFDVQFFYQGLGEEVPSRFSLSHEQYEVLKLAVQRIAADNERTSGGNRKKMPLRDAIKVARRVCDLLGWSYSGGETDARHNAVTHELPSPDESLVA
jgi:transcriptional regulator with XRE-family HTH domain